MERQEGYYWVKYDGEFVIGYWRRWCTAFELIGGDAYFGEGQFEHINENRIKYPGELPD